MPPISLPSKLLSLIILIFLGSYQIFFGELIPVYSGLGFDGALYGRMTMEFEHFVTVMPSYLIVRILPSFIIHLCLKALHIPLNTENIIFAFQIFNLGMMLIALTGWWLISEELKLSRKGFWLGFAALFINFPMLRAYFYEPVIVDVAGFTLSVYLLFFYLRKNTKGLIMAGLLGALTWPIVLFVAGLLLVFPRATITAPANPDGNKKLAGTAVIVAALAAGFCFSLNSHFIYALGLFCMLYYLWSGIVNFTSLPRIQFKKKISWIHILIVMICLIEILIFFKSNLILLILATSFIRPFNFLVAHILWYGPFVVLILLLWKRTTRIIAQFGPGMILLFFFGFLLSASAVSRHLLALYVFFVTFTILAFESLTWPRHFYVIFTFLSLLYSHIWLKFNIGSLQETLNLYWMTHGQMMTPEYYYRQLPLIIVTTIIFYWIHKKTRSA